MGLSRATWRLLLCKYVGTIVASTRSLVYKQLKYLRLVDVAKFLPNLTGPYPLLKIFKTKHLLAHILLLCYWKTFEILGINPLHLESMNNDTYCM